MPRKPPRHGGRRPRVRTSPAGRTTGRSPRSSTRSSTPRTSAMPTNSRACAPTRTSSSPICRAWWTPRQPPAARLLAQQNRASISKRACSTARLPRVIMDPFQPLSFKHEKDTDFRDTVVTLLLDNSAHAGAPDHRGGHLRRHPRAHLERCGVKVEILGFTTRAWKGGQRASNGCTGQAGESRPPQRSAPSSTSRRTRPGAARGRISG